MNFRPGSLPRLSVCHSRRAGFSDSWPTIGLRTIASLKWSTTEPLVQTRFRHVSASLGLPSFTRGERLLGELSYVFIKMENVASYSMNKRAVARAE